MTVTQRQLRRGTTAQCVAMTPAQGEPVFDTTLNQIRIGDGVTAGGHVVPALDASGNLALLGNLTVAGTLGLTGALTYGGVLLTAAVSGTGAMVLATAPGLTNPTVTTQAAGDHTTKAASTAFVQQASVQWAVAAGTADALTAAYAVTVASLTDGLMLAFRAVSANATTTPTFKADGTVAHTITRLGGAALLAGDIVTAGEYLVRYNLANTRWELLTPAKVPPQVGGKPTNRFTNFTNTTVFTNATTSFEMGGFGSSFKLTPVSTGNIRVSITFKMQQGTGGGTGECFINFGTGTAPLANAAETGTRTTTTAAIAFDASSNLIIPAHVQVEISGLTLSTAYWFDIAATAAVSGNMVVTPIAVIIEEF